MSLKYLDIHTLPVNDLREHEQTRTCWCKPDIYRICTVCDDDDDNADCWLCGGNGALDAEPEYEGAVMVVHEALDGRE
jgi:hypothetical protein